MKEGKKSCVLSGIFLLIFALPAAVIFAAVIGGIFGAASFDLFELCGFIAAVLLVTAGILMMIGKLNAAAMSVLSAAVFYAVYSFPQTASYFDGKIEQFETALPIPRYYVLCPVFAIISLVLFSATLLLKNRISLFVAILSSSLGVIALVLQFRSFNYIAGHPTVLNLLPVNIILSEFFSGFKTIKV